MATLVPIIKAALDRRPAEPETSKFALDPSTLPRFAGTYRDETSGLVITVSVQDAALVAQAAGQPPISLVATSATAFRAATIPNVSLSFSVQGDQE